MIANKNVALPHGKNRKTTKSDWPRRKRQRSAAGITPHRKSHRQRRDHARRNDQQERDAAHPAGCHMTGLPPLSIGTSTRNAAKINATPSRASSTTAKLLARLRGI